MSDIESTILVTKLTCGKVVRRTLLPLVERLVVRFD